MPARQFAWPDSLVTSPSVGTTSIELEATKNESLSATRRSGSYEISADPDASFEVKLPRFVLSQRLETWRVRVLSFSATSSPSDSRGATAAQARNRHTALSEAYLPEDD